jgi:hypothetical protein
MKTVCIDFDGVIHAYTSPLVDLATISDEPLPGAFEFLTDCLEPGCGWP